MYAALLLTLLLPLVRPASVALAAAPSPPQAASLATYTLTLDRSQDPQGTSITPTPISTPFCNIVLIFDAGFSLQAMEVLGYSNYTVGAGKASVWVPSGALSSVFVLQLGNVGNPGFAGVPVTISMQIRDSNQQLIDSASTTLAFTTIVMPMSQISYSFTPANVSTLSTLSLTIGAPFLNPNQGMYLQLLMRRFWSRSLTNTTSTSILASTSTCIPSCLINRQTATNVVSFTNTSLQNIFINSTLRIQIIDVRSPPTVEPADEFQLVVKDSVYGSVVARGDGLMVGAGLANYMDTLQAQTGSLVGESATVVLSVLSRNVFGPNDTVTIRLAPGSGLTSTNPDNIQLQSSLVSSYQKDIQDLNTIILSGFTFLTANFARLDTTLTLAHLAPQPSTRPSTGHTITLRRNGFIYNYGQFDYQVAVAAMRAVSIALGSNLANSNTSASVRVQLAGGVAAGDRVMVGLPEGIVVHGCGVGCAQCSCAVAAPSFGVPGTRVTVSLGDGSAAVMEVNISLSVRNPVGNNNTVTVCSTDSFNYSKQCLSAPYPGTTSAPLAPSLLSLSASNSTVACPTNLTLRFDLTNYDLQPGSLLAVVPLRMLTTSNHICLFNSQPACNIAANQSGTYITIAIMPSTKIYTIKINNMRNPISTEPVIVTASIRASSGEVYYTLSSDYYYATELYILQQGTHFQVTSSTCTNWQQNLFTLTFTALPLDLGRQFPGFMRYRVRGQRNSYYAQVVYPVGNGTASVMSFSARNWYSLEPIVYEVTLLTGDGVYSVWRFALVVGNCRPQGLQILAYQFTGLPGDPGTLTFSYLNVLSPVLQPNNPNYSLLLTFPAQHPASLSPVTDSGQSSVPAPRTLRLRLLPGQQPVTVRLSNFTNVININNNYTNGPVMVEVYEGEYLVARDNGTLRYRLAELSGCAFPCRRCDAGGCMECYGADLTEQYLLAIEVVNGSSMGRCVSASKCPVSTVANLTINRCQACPPGCSTCTTLACLTCLSNFYSLNSSCVTSCPATLYPSTPSQQCLPCLPPCLTCTGPSTCLSCSLGFYMLEAVNCVSTCPSGYLISQQQQQGNLCQRCAFPCKQCLGVVGNCSSCVDGYYMEGGRCVAVCGGGLVGERGLCRACAPTCLACFNTTETCVGCVAPFLLAGTKCVTACPDGLYSDAAICLPCPSECTLCRSPTQCSRCGQGFFLYNSLCLAFCPASTFPLTTPPSPQCHPCTHPQCLLCPAGVNTCQACSNSYLLASTCTTNCPTGTAPTGPTCTPCASSCLDCLSPTVCTRCVQGLVLAAGVCLERCAVGWVAVEGVCRECGGVVLGCVECTELGCSRCRNGTSLYVNESGPVTACRAQCPSGYITDTILNISVCTKCSQSCLTCSQTRTNCTTCAPPLVLLSNQCAAACPPATTPINSQCVPCDPPCLTCSTPAACLSCPNGSYLHSSKCLSACPAGHYADDAQLICSTCDQGCSSCVAQGCLQCMAGYYRVSRASNDNNSVFWCVGQCPIDMPFVVEGGVCAKCAQGCVQCLSNGTRACVVCQLGLYGYGQQCVRVCPVLYTVLDGACVMVGNGTTNNTQNNTQDNTSNTTNLNTTAMTLLAPAPFSIATGSAVALVAISRLQHPSTSPPLALLGLSSLLVPVCGLYYLGVGWPLFVFEKVQADEAGASQSYLQERVALILIIVSMGVIYLSNLIHMVLGVATFRRDPCFLNYTHKHTLANALIAAASLLTQHLSFSLYFCRLFNLPVFAASLQHIHSLHYTNYSWGITLVGNVLGVAAGIMAVSQGEGLVFMGVDLLVVNAVVLVLGLLLFRKAEGQGWARNAAEDSEVETRKVVRVSGSGYSEVLIGVEGESMEEVGGVGSDHRREAKDLEAVQPEDIPSEDIQPEVILADDAQENKQKQSNNDFLYFQDSLRQMIDSSAATDDNKQPSDDLPDLPADQTLRIQSSLHLVLMPEQMKNNEPAAEGEDLLPMDEPVEDIVSEVSQAEELNEPMVNQLSAQQEMELIRDSQLLKEGLDEGEAEILQVGKQPAKALTEGKNESVRSLRSVRSGLQKSKSSSSSPLKKSIRIERSQLSSPRLSAQQSVSPIKYKSTQGKDKRINTTRRGSLSQELGNKTMSESINSQSPNKQQRYGRKKPMSKSTSVLLKSGHMGVIEEEVLQAVDQGEMNRKQNFSGILSALTQQSKIQKVLELEEIEKTISRSSFKTGKKSKNTSPQANPITKKSISPENNRKSREKTLSKHSNHSQDSHNNQVNLNSKFGLKSPQRKQNSRLGIDKSSQKIIQAFADADKNNQQAKLNLQSNKKISGIQTIDFEEDESADGQTEDVAHEFELKRGMSRTIFPKSAAILPKNYKLRTIQGQQTRRKRNGTSLISKTIQQAQKSPQKIKTKSFRSRNISADKIRPVGGYFIEAEAQTKKINPKALLEQIERKEKIRSHRESLKKIYLGK